MIAWMIQPMPEINAKRIAMQKGVASPFAMKHPTKNPTNAITAIITTAQIAFIEITPFINLSVGFIFLYLPFSFLELYHAGAIL